ncbi:MAG TPA: hypothetical protein VHE30_22260 [Polyangiaceae bacterium]|nr:hypothetical protein [Polyangiaceae bacterium]
MTDLDDESLPEWTDEELAVLRSADGDAPGARSLAATLAAVGTGTAVASGAAAAKAGAGTGTVASAKWGSGAVLVKWLGGLLVAGAAVAGGAAWVRSHRAPVAEVRTEATVATTEAPEAPPVPQPIAAAESAVVPAAAEAPAAPTSEPATPSHGAVETRKPASQPDISQEIASLDAARGALRSGRATEALAALDRYDRAFARTGSLRVEATALRIEALERSGSHARAVSLANGFLARNPKSPYAARVRSLVLGDSAQK